MRRDSGRRIGWGASSGGRPAPSQRMACRRSNLKETREFALRINEAYEHEALRSCQSEETSCPISGCNKVSTQCVDVSAPVVLAPTASLGSPTVTCQGSPSVTCVTSSDKTHCTVTLTQQVCVSIPVCYGVSMATGEVTIACADGGAGGCHCRG